MGIIRVVTATNDIGRVKLNEIESMNSLKDTIIRMRYGSSKPGDDSNTYSDVSSIAADTKTNRRLIESILLSVEYDRLSADAKAIVN